MVALFCFVNSSILIDHSYSQNFTNAMKRYKSSLQDVIAKFNVGCKICCAQWHNIVSITFSYLIENQTSMNMCRSFKFSSLALYGKHLHGDDHCCRIKFYIYIYNISVINGNEDCSNNWLVYSPIPS